MGLWDGLSQLTFQMYVITIWVTSFLEVLCLGEIFKKRRISKSVSYLIREFDHFSFPKDAAKELEVYHQCNAL